LLIRLALQFAAMVVAVIIMVQVVPGIDVDSFWGYVQVAGLMALVNTIVKPIVKLFTAPIILMTLGLAMFVINAILLRLVVGVADDASIDGFGSAFVGSIILTIASFATGWVLSIGEGKKADAA
jgi:putative membrane protein